MSLADHTLISDLIRAGVDADLVGRVSNALLLAASSSPVSGGSPVDAAAEKRRAYDRERKAVNREILRKSGGSPVEVLESLSPSKETQEIKPKKEEGRKSPPTLKSGHILPDDWKPNEHHYQLGIDLGRQHHDVDDKAEEVRLWAKSNEHRAIARKSNWDAMFTGCLRRDWAKQNGATNGHRPLDNRNPYPPGPQPAGPDAITAAVARSAARRHAERISARPPGDDAPKGPDDGFL